MDTRIRSREVAAVAYEVIKRVGSRAYRYRVESYRDGAKVRARWTYLGVATPEAPGAPRESVDAGARRSPKARSTRERLVDAFERLAERAPYAALTADAVATEAGVAHGTFYRYFTNKREILAAALERVRESLDRARPSFDPPYGDLAAERTRMRAWTTALGSTSVSRGLVAAWYDALEADPELEAARVERVRERRLALERYLDALRDAGTIDMTDVPAVASALTTLVDAAFRSAVVSGTDGQLALAGVADVFDRTIFCRPTP
ncbi:MAG: hypothetical protein NVSMB21_20790 [Vulcanimicrobiaceae bacterium]